MSMFTKIPAFFNLRRQQNRDREDGVTYQQTMTNRYTAPEVTAAKIRELEDNAYLVKLEQNQRNLIFCEKVEISVKGPDGEVDEELSKTVTNMCDAEDVRLNQKLIMVWSSVFRYGAAFVNDVWGWRGNEYRLLNLRILPSWTFADLPVSQTEYIAYGDILRGVVLNKNGDMEFWQKQSDTDNPVQVTNVTMITDPTEHAIAGTPGCLPAVHIINMLSYCHSAQMKKVNRVGAPSIFPKITEKVNRTAKEGGDASYLKTMLQNWGINVGFILRDNMEFADPHLPEESCALDTIKHYEGILDRIYSPTSMITKDGTLIGGSNLGELELMKMYISSVHRWLEEAAESLLQHYLDVNRYSDYTVEVTLPSFEVDETPLNIQRVTAMKATPTSGALATPDEMRELLGLPPMTDEIRAELQPVVQPPKEPPEPEPEPEPKRPEPPKPPVEQLQRKEKPVQPIPDKPPDVDTEIDGYEAGLIKVVDKFESDTITTLQTCYTNKKQMNRKISPPAPIDTSQFTALLLKIAQTTVEAAQNIIHSFAERGYLQGVRFAGGQLEPMRMQFAFNMPYDKAVIQVLKDRNVAAFKGVTDDMAKEIMRQVTEGALKGQTVNTIAGNIRSVCSDIGKQRSILIARTELMKAVNEGVLRRFEDSGVEQVLRLETADERTCTDHKFVIDGKTYYGCQPEEDGGIGGKILTMDQAWQVQAQQHPKCRGSFAPKFKGLELSMKNNDDEAGHWVTNDDGNHIFITDKGELKTSPGGQVIGYAKDTDTWQVQNQAKKGMHMPQSSYTKAATPGSESPKVEPPQPTPPKPTSSPTPAEWTPGSHESLKDAPEPVKKQIAPGEIYDGRQYRLTVNDKKKVSISMENIEQRKEEAKAEAGKLIDAKKEKLGKKYGLTKRDAMAQAVLSVQRSSEDYRLGIGQGKLDRLTGNDYQNWRATPEYNMEYHEGFLEKLPAIIDQASFNPNLYAAQQIRNQKGGG